MTDLPDVNVWLALVDENHVHHERAIAYWCEQSAAEIAFCRVTALAFLRLSTHAKILSCPLSPKEAWDIYQRYRDEAEEGFIHSLWTDCYLAALASFRNCRVVSFDQDFHRFPKLAFLDISS